MSREARTYTNRSRQRQGRQLERFRHQLDLVPKVEAPRPWPAPPSEEVCAQARRDYALGSITLNQMRSRCGLRPLTDDLEKSVKPLRHYWQEEIEVSRQKVTAFVATCLVIGGIIGWIIWKLWP